MRKDQKLSKAYQKNKRFEKVISSLNENLELAQKELLEDIAEQFSTLHILGAPRSGTTLVSQLIPSVLDVAHINNFIAAFWKAPIYGIELSKKLIGETYRSQFSSDFGRTSGINEPHEFGYFWNYHLKYESLQQQPKSHEENIDWESLSYLLKNMTHAFGKPILFKSFLMGFHAGRLYQELPKSKFIYIKRNLADNVNSILKLREKMNGDIHTWGSIKPIQYETLKHLDVHQQIVGQILCMESEYVNQLSSVPESHKLLITYEEVCTDTQGFLQKVQKLLGSSVEFSTEHLPDLKVQTKTTDSTIVEKIEEAKAKIIQRFPTLNLLNL